MLFSVGANHAHGLRRTNEDKRRAVTTLLLDAQWTQWSDREISRRCGVDHKTVGAVRAQLQTTGEIPQSDQRTGADGRVTNTANIGNKTSASATVGIRQSDQRNASAAPVFTVGDLVLTPEGRVLQVGGVDDGVVARALDNQKLGFKPNELTRSTSRTIRRSQLTPAQRYGEAICRAGTGCMECGRHRADGCGCAEHVAQSPFGLATVRTPGGNHGHRHQRTESHRCRRFAPAPRGYTDQNRPCACERGNRRVRAVAPSASAEAGHGAALLKH